MDVVFTLDELRRCLPPAGRYRVEVQAVTPSPDGPRPDEVRITWAVIDLPNRPPIYERFVLRGALSLALPGMRRFLGLLRHAGIAVRPDHPVDLGALVGLECFIDVERAIDASGFPYSLIARHQLVASRNSAPRATGSGSSNPSRNGGAPSDARAGLDHATARDALRRAPGQRVVHDPGAKRRSDGETR